MWRDELHCWLVARDSATPWDVVHNRAYDGQPPLWYLVLWVLEKTTHRPVVMRVVHVAIASACVWVFARKASFARAIRALFPFGYFLAYEYVAISRCYGLALLLVLLLCVNHPRHGSRRPLDGRTAMAPCAPRAHDHRGHRRCRGVRRGPRPLRGVGRRGPIGENRARDRAMDPHRRSGLRLPRSRRALRLAPWPGLDGHPHALAEKSSLRTTHRRASSRGLAPIPRVDFFFWNSNALLSFEPLRHVALVVSALLAAWVVFVLARDRTAAIVFGLGAALLVTLFGVRLRRRRPPPRVLLRSLRHGRLDRRRRGAAGQAASGWSRFPSRPRSVTTLIAAILAPPHPGRRHRHRLRHEVHLLVRNPRGRRAEGARTRGRPPRRRVRLPRHRRAPGSSGPNAVAYSPRTGRPFSFVKWTSLAPLGPDRRSDARLRVEARLLAQRAKTRSSLMNRPLRPEPRGRHPHHPHRRALRLDDRGREFLHLPRGGAGRDGPALASLYMLSICPRMGQAWLPVFSEYCWW